MSEHPISENFQGQPAPGLREPRHYSQFWAVAGVEEVNGDAAAAGTLIAEILIPPGRVLIIHDVTIAAKNAAKTVILVQSTTAAVGGAEVVQKTYDLPAAGVLVDRSANGPVAIINNQLAVNLWAMLRMTQNRLGAAGNNAVGQFVAGSIAGYLE